MSTRASAFPLLLAALDAWFNAHAEHAFHTGVSGRLVYHDAPRDWPMPYAVLDVPIQSCRDTFTERITYVGIQIVVYAASKQAATSLASSAAELFGGQRIPGEGLIDFRFSRGDDIPATKVNDATWQAGSQLTGYVQMIQ